MFHIGVFHIQCFMNWVGEVDRELTFVTSTPPTTTSVAKYSMEHRPSNLMNSPVYWNSESMIFGGITAPKPA